MHFSHIYIATGVTWCNFSALFEQKAFYISPLTSEGLSFLQTAPLLINVLLALMLKAEKRAAGSAMEEIAHTWTQYNMATGRQT